MPYDIRGTLRTKKKLTPKKVSAQEGNDWEVHHCFTLKLKAVILLLWFKQNLFIHCNPEFNKQVQETQKQYAYLSATYRQNDNYTDIYDGKMANGCQNPLFVYLFVE